MNVLHAIRAALALTLSIPAIAAPPPLASGINLASASYGSKEYPFIDLWKLRGGQSKASPLYDASGEPTGVDPAASVGIGMGIMDGKHSYDVITDGTVTALSFAGGVVGKHPSKLALTGKNTTQFVIDHQGATSFSMRSSGPVKVAIVPTDLRARYEAGEIFQPQFVEMLRGFSVLRFMDWNATNGRFSDGTRALVTDPAWSPRVPVEVQAMLCNQIGADMWLNIPAGADGGMVVEMVTAAHKTLAPGLMIYLEYSNEIWNQGFKQTGWMNGLATSAKIPNTQMYGLLSGNMAKAAATVAGPDRVRTILAWQGSGTAGAGPVIIKGWDQSGASRSSLEGFAVATYPDVDKADAAQWTAWAKANDYASALTYMLGRAKVRTAYYPRIAAMAKTYGVSWSLYETNPTGLPTNAPSPIAVADRPMVLAFNQAFAHRPETQAIAAAIRADFDAAGGKLFVQFNDVGIGSQYGQWGTLGASSLDVSFPAAARVRAANDAAWLSRRAPTGPGWLGASRTQP